MLSSSPHIAKREAEGSNQEEFLHIFTDQRKKQIFTLAQIVAIARRLRVSLALDGRPADFIDALIAVN